MINVVLFEPEIPQNTGNIMRTCAGTGVNLHLIEPLGFRLDEKSIKRSGVNYIEHCNYKVYSDFDEFKKNNDRKFYFFTRYGKKPHTDFDFSNTNDNIYLIFGKESTGIPKEILKDNLDKCIRIPMVDKARSLNLSNTVAIMLFEVYRQLDYVGLSKVEVIKGEDFLENF